jgi:acyl carrier protein
VELGEIESVLLRHDEINEAAVVAIENESGAGGPGEGAGEIYIAAYIVSDRRIEPSELSRYLSRHLPDYMKPAYLEQIDAIPLTISGKIDRKALPMPTAVSGTRYAAPGDEIEEKMVEIWAEVLDQPHSSIGIDDNFFHLGGHSLKAALLVSKVHRELAVRLPLAQIFKTPSVREVCRYLKETQKERFSTIPRLEEREYYDVSHAQQRVWIQSQEKRVSLSFNMNGAYAIEMDMDGQVLDNIFKTLIQRHESLRTVFIPVNGKPKQKILAPDKTGFGVGYIDLRDPRDEALQNRIRESVMSESDTLFDLSMGPLLRVKLIRVKERTFIFLFTMHHIIGDGLSLGVFFREVFLLYRGYREGKANPLPPLRIHYKDYAAWQNRELSGEKLEAVKTYWLEQLGGTLPRLQLPLSKERPKIMTYKGGTVYLNIDGSLTGQLRSLARRRGTTLFTVLLAVFKALLARYTGQGDIIIGTVAACREYAELENQVGYYLNTLALRTAVEPGDSFNTLLKKVKETTLGAYEHQLYPFDRLVGDLGIPRDVSRHPIFDIVIDMVNYQAEQAQTQENPAGSGVKVSPYVTGYHKSKFDLTVYIFEARERMGLKFEYMTDIFEHEIIQRMSDRFLKLLKRIAAGRESGRSLAGLLEEHDEEIVFPGLHPFAGVGEQVPASYHQERLWFIDRFESGNIYESGRGA